MLRLAVFLGNPGAEYACNRHNAGRLLAARLPFSADLSWTKKFKSRYVQWRGEPLSDSIKSEAKVKQYLFHFIQPETYMNLSGDSVAAAAAFFKLKPEEIIVVHDELELPLGTLSLKFGGGLGGHNGLRSIKERLGDAGFWRLRIGIGRPAGRLPGEGGQPVKGVHNGGTGEIAAWVLTDFTAAEETALEAVLASGTGVLAAALVRGPDTLLPEWKKNCIMVSKTIECTVEGTSAQHNT